MITLIPDMFAPPALPVAPIVHAQSTDAEILAALRDHSTLLVGLQMETQTAFHKARHNDSDWQSLDGQHNSLRYEITRNARASESAGPNSAADHAARVATIRALLAARDSFIAQADDGRPKLANPVPTALYAKRLQKVYDAEMESKWLAGEFGPGLVLEGKPTFTPTQIHNPKVTHRHGGR